MELSVSHETIKHTRIERPWLHPVGLHDTMGPEASLGEYKLLLQEIAPEKVMCSLVSGDGV